MNVRKAAKCAGSPVVPQGAPKFPACRTYGTITDCADVLVPVPHAFCAATVNE